MDTKDILKSLTSLEQNLKNIDSARQQVLNTVNAYESTRIELAKIAPEIQSISGELSNIFNLIKENQDSFNQDISQKFKNVFSNIQSKVESLDNATKTIQVEFKSVCDDTSNKLISTINNSRTLLDDGNQKAIKKINEKAKEELDNITNLLSTFKDTTENIQNNFQTSTGTVQNNQKIAQNEIISNFKQAINDSLLTFNKGIEELNAITSQLSNQKRDIINEFNIELKKMLDSINSITTLISDEKATNETQYTDIINKLKSLRDGNVKAANNLSERFNKTDNSLLEIKNLIIEKDKKIKTEIAVLKKNNNQLLKLVIFLIVAVSISIIIGILGII